MVRFYRQFSVDDKTFFLLFMGAGSCWLDSTISSFSSSLSGIADSSKSQLVSSCDCLATLFYSHKDFSTSLWHHLQDFYSPSPLEGMCWRGIVPSHTIFTRDTYFSHANFPCPLVGGGKRMARHFGITVSHCPAIPVYETFVGVCMW